MPDRHAVLERSLRRSRHARVHAFSQVHVGHLCSQSPQIAPFSLAERVRTQSSPRERRAREHSGSLLVALHGGSPSFTLAHSIERNDPSLNARASSSFRVHREFHVREGASLLGHGRQARARRLGFLQRSSPSRTQVQPLFSPPSTENCWISADLKPSSRISASSAWSVLKIRRESKSATASRCARRPASASS